MSNQHKIYTYDEKVILSEKIRKITNKNNLINIIKIIYEDNKDIFENKNGIYMFFHKLSNQTYEKIENELKKITNKTSDATNSIEKKEICSLCQR